MQIDQLVFRKPLEEYKSRLDPMKEYIKQAKNYVRKYHPDLEEDELEKYMLQALKTFKLENPVVTFNHREENGDANKDQLKLLDYIKVVQDNNEILAPSWTTYLHPSKKRSLHSDYLFSNIKQRNYHKKLGFKFELEGQIIKSKFHDNMQKTMKIKNNSLSGSYISNGTSLTNPSAHSTLTSTTRSVASIGNATTESVSMGNKCFRNVESVICYITAIITNIDMNVLTNVMEKYNLHYPSTIEVFQMIKRSTKYYFNLPSMDKYIIGFITHLDPVEKAAVLYVNDLYHLRKHNPEFIRKLIAELSVMKTGYSTDRLKDLNEVQEGVTNHAHMVCANLIKGKSINYKDMVDTPEVDAIASTSKYVGEVLTKYKDFIQLFFITNVAPINIAYVKDLQRRAIVLSDTDSTCGAYDDWVKWYYGVSDFTDDGKYIAVASSVMLIVTQVIDHYIKLLEGNMNVDINNMELLKMKNEFYWYSFTPMNQSKHYIADVAVKEGNVYEKSKKEVKGVHLLASQVAARYREVTESIITEIRAIGRTDKEIDLFYFVKKVADVERDIIQKIREGSLEIFSLNLIKPAKAYKLGPDRSPYFHHMLWTEVFSGKYGDAGEPAYHVIKVPVELTSKNELNEYIKTIEDKQIAGRLATFLANHNKNGIGMFMLPYLQVRSKGLPEEIFHCLNYHKLVTASCFAMYVLLESIGFYKPNDKLISELGPY